MPIQIAQTQEPVDLARTYLDKINENLLFPLITLMMAVALLIFLYGLFEYVRNSSSEQGRVTGRQHILWGIVGLLVMLSAFSILKIAAGTFDLRQELDTAAGDNPFGTTFTP